MRLLIVIGVCVVGLFGCDSSDDSGGVEPNFTSSSIVSVSGSEIPTEADLVIYWGRVSSRQDVEFFIAGGGELSNGSFVIEPPVTVPSDAISEGIGVAVGLVIAYPKGMAPAVGAYQELDLFAPVGYVNAHSIVYRSADFVAPEHLSEFEGWWDKFNLGFECARNIESVSDQLFDSFEPIECSEMIMRIGIVSEIVMVGGDWN